MGKSTSTKTTNGNRVVEAALGDQAMSDGIQSRQTNPDGSVVGRGVSTFRNREDDEEFEITINSWHQSASGEITAASSAPPIKSGEVSEAIAQAIGSCLRDGLSRTEADKLELLRQDVASFGVNDGRFDAQETQAIVRRADRIIRGID